jgi:hypothetical protein
VELPSSNGFNAIFVCVDRLTKMAHFIPTNTTVTAEESAELYLKQVFQLHGLPGDIVSDRGAQFTSKFTRRLLELLDIRGNKSTSHHPQSDGQTERVNQTLEQYLRIYCDYQQGNWNELLPLAEFVYNNSESASTKMTPFFANHGFHPRCTLKISTTEDSTNPTAEDWAAKLQEVHAQLRKNLQEAQKQYKRQYDKGVKDPPTFQVGDKVWLTRRNIKTTRPSQKLDVKRLGPFKILKVIGESKLAYKLELPKHMRIHPVFHVSLLEPYHANILPGREQPEPPPEEIEGEEEWEVKEVLDSKIVRGRLRYLVDWEGYSEDQRSWEPAEFLKHALKAITAFHRRHPNRPSLTDLPKCRHRSSGVRSLEGGTVTTVLRNGLRNGEEF